MADFDGEKVHALAGKMLGDLCGTYSAPTVRVGFRLGPFNMILKARI